MKPLYLHPGREKRILRGHRWIFSNEVADSLFAFEPGSWVEVFSSKRVLLGSGYINPHSLIAVRLVCPPGQHPDRDFFAQLLTRAAQRREALYPDSNCYRLFYGDSDGIPGLVIDRYEDTLVYQITTMGMARLEALIQELLIELFAPAALVYRNDTSIRSLEGLPIEKGVAYGELSGPRWIDLDGVQYGVDFLEGQKTGLYLDQRENRRALQRWVKGKRVLDLYCYEGAWGLMAARAGAESVVGVDQSSRAVGRARANASRNGMDDLCRFEAADVFSFLKKVEKGAFDVIILDPPAFAKARASLADAQKGYTDHNRRALLALTSGSLLATCSCSYHLTEPIFLEALTRAGQASGRQLRLLERRGQAPDHPVLLAMPETHYLKCYFLEVV